MSLDETNYMLSKFNFVFSWRSTGDLGSTLPEIIRILKEDDGRSLDQIMIGCVNQAIPALIFSEAESDTNHVPFKMNFTAHPSHEMFCITNIVLLSEAKNLELYANGEYETSTRGVRLTINKEKQSSLFEAQFDLSSHVNKANSDIEIKFLSHSCKDHIRIQAAILKVGKCKPIESMSSTPLDLSSVKQYLGSVGRPLSKDAQKMLNSIETYQNSQAFKAQQMFTTQAELVSNSSTQGTRDQAREKGCKSKLHQSPVNMLMKLGIGETVQQRPPGTTEDRGKSSPQSRWAAYLQSRARASRLTTLGATEIDDYIGTETECCTHREGRLGSSPDSYHSMFVTGEEAKQRCKMCGCPGCYSLFDSLSQNINAAEATILEKIDEKFTQIQNEMNSKFQLLYEQLHVNRKECSD